MWNLQVSDLERDCKITSKNQKLNKWRPSANAPIFANVHRSESTAYQQAWEDTLINVHINFLSLTTTEFQEYLLIEPKCSRPYKCQFPVKKKKIHHKKTNTSLKLSLCLMFLSKLKSCPISKKKKKKINLLPLVSFVKCREGKSSRNTSLRHPSRLF